MTVEILLGFGLIFSVIINAVLLGVWRDKNQEIERLKVSIDFELDFSTRLRGEFHKLNRKIAFLKQKSKPFLDKLYRKEIEAKKLNNDLDKLHEIFGDSLGE